LKLITHKLFLLTGHSKSTSHKVTIKHGYSHVIKVGHIFSRFRRLGVRLVGRGILYDGHCKYCLILRTANYLTHSIAQKLNNIMFPSSSFTSNTCIYIYILSTICKSRLLMALCKSKSFHIQCIFFILWQSRYSSTVLSQSHLSIYMI
jgi:hypothetical protein